MVAGRLPGRFKAADEKVASYLVFSNTHDGSASTKVAITPVRVVCQNTLKLALSTTKRSWSTTHVGDIGQKLEEARKTILFAKQYMPEETTSQQRGNNA